MPKVTQEHRDARRHEIVNAALRLVARQGFEATSMADIIAESGLSAGAIYGYYKSKDELIHSAITELLELRFEAAMRRDPGQPVIAPGEMMKAFLAQLHGGLGDLGLLVQVWGQAVLDPTSRLATESIGEHLRYIWRDYLQSWFSEALGLEDAAALATRFAPVYLGVMQGYIVQTAVFGVFDAEDYLAAASALRPGELVIDRESVDWDT